MGNNVNTLPSNDVDSFSIRWITFATRDKENVIDAKKMMKGKNAYIPDVGKVQNTYIVEKNNIWMRCIKVAKKLKARIDKKYAQKSQGVSR